MITFYIHDLSDVNCKKLQDIIEQNSWHRCSEILVEPNNSIIKYLFFTRVYCRTLDNLNSILNNNTAFLLRRIPEIEINEDILEYALDLDQFKFSVVSNYRDINFDYPRATDMCIVRELCGVGYYGFNIHSSMICIEISDSGVHRGSLTFDDISTESILKAIFLPNEAEYNRFSKLLSVSKDTLFSTVVGTFTEVVLLNEERLQSLLDYKKRIADDFMHEVGSTTDTGIYHRLTNKHGILINLDKISEIMEE